MWDKGSLARLVHGLHFNRSMICEIDGQRSEPCPLTCGVPQGSILGPMLFLIYVSDFEKYLHFSKVINYADDTVTYLSKKTHWDRTRLKWRFTIDCWIFNQKQNRCCSVLGKNKVRMVIASDCIIIIKRLHLQRSTST